MGACRVSIIHWVNWFFFLTAHSTLGSQEDFENLKDQVKSTIVNMGVAVEDADEIMKMESMDKSILN